MAEYVRIVVVSTPIDRTRDLETTVTARYWAGARSAAGVDEDVFEVTGPISLAEVVSRVLTAHPGPDVARTIGVCSVLLGDRPVSSKDAAEVVVDPGATVEFLPPFAGG